MLRIGNKDYRISDFNSYMSSNQTQTKQETNFPPKYTFTYSQYIKSRQYFNLSSVSQSTILLKRKALSLNKNSSSKPKEEPKKVISQHHIPSYSSQNTTKTISRPISIPKTRPNPVIESYVTEYKRMTSNFKTRVNPTHMSCIN
jgi:hypothetical protein